MNPMRILETWILARRIARHNARCAERPFGTLLVQTMVPRVAGDDREDGKVLSSFMSRTSTDPQADLRAIEAALELRDAVLRRGVAIDPYDLYKHIIGQSYWPRGPDKSVAEIEKTDRVGAVSTTTVTRFK